MILLLRGRPFFVAAVTENDGPDSRALCLPWERDRFQQVHLSPFLFDQTDGAASEIYLYSCYDGRNTCPLLFLIRQMEQHQR
jgi:hypothetical protein